MANLRPKNRQSNSLLQLLVTFVIPFIILSRFSNESSLGPTMSLILALAFPIVYELYNISIKKKPSMLSAIAIGGILVTGAITLLGLSEGWLALRRSIPYAVAGIALVASIFIERPILNAILPSILDMDRVEKALAKEHHRRMFNKKLNEIGYLLAGMLFLVAIITYVLTSIAITSQTGTAEFNQEYAELRLLSILYVTLPLVLGTTAILVYLMKIIEKLTGIEVEELLKKR